MKHKLVTLDPGHFHAALIQKEMSPEVSPRVAAYAPLGREIIDHMSRIARFNSRAQNPTSWELDVHCSADFLERMLKDRPGDVVVLSGRNRGKINYIKACLENGLHVLADKPWILTTLEFPKLQEVLETAERNGLIAYDVMTERHEVTSILQRELVNNEGIFGALLKGTQDEPAVVMESVHHLLKTVAGEPLLRPAWFFDIDQQGEGLSDVGTHLVDLVQWTLLPEQAVDFRKDIEVIDALRWPTRLTLEEFQRVTGENTFPGYLKTGPGGLDYFCNNTVHYRLRGVHVKVTALWNYQAAPGAGDTHLAMYRGTRSRVEVRQGKQENYRPELYVAPNRTDEKPAVYAALRQKIGKLVQRFPGLGIEDRGPSMRILIPDEHRIGHEAHFAQVARQFFAYLNRPDSLPAWENPNMLAKYYVTTKGIELCKQRN